MQPAVHVNVETEKNASLFGANTCLELKLLSGLILHKRPVANRVGRERQLAVKKVGGTSGGARLELSPVVGTVPRQQVY